MATQTTAEIVAHLDGFIADYQRQAQALGAIALEPSVPGAERITKFAEAVSVASAAMLLKNIVTQSANEKIALFMAKSYLDNLLETNAHTSSVRLSMHVINWLTPAE